MAVAASARTINGSITRILRDIAGYSASGTGAAAGEVLHAAQSLAGESNRLKLEVGKFMHTVRAA
ncbi:hypothetical protein I8G32_04437 [Rhodopseudomonas palustris]|uniref:Methyl-accepting chemotaxis protein n=1 Tax=Rhodopseudomonas palustris (strain ATCC BAA-98 / CGA009) TaxID=258594 RepID=Q6N1V3_RHOPA|nr:hypothetical protein I8G32_04437 [Rhodopseudomonas palustris]CAE29742.1 hypothetical protein RPA4301 [Rhodopseudomonas palustris CGA009]